MSIEQEIHFCTTADGVRIGYATAGQGPPLVKAANWLNHLEFDWQSPIWRHVLEEFGRDHLLVRYDERGNGLSDWNVKDLSFEAFVSDLESVVDALGLDRFPILGISQGGPVAIAYAVRHPEKVSHLILYGSFVSWRGLSSQQRELRLTLVELIRLGWGQENPAFRQAWTSLYFPDGTAEQWQWFNELQRISTSPENAYRLVNVLRQIDVTKLLPQVKAPTLVVHRRGDAVVPFEKGRLLAASIPGARFVPLDGKNHLLLETEPAWPIFVTEVRRFLGAERQPSRNEAPPAIKTAASKSVFVGRYEIRAKIGEGGMGEVYLAEDTLLERNVAIKFLTPQAAADDRAKKRLLREARAAAKLDHPHICSIYEVDEVDGRNFFVMQYVEGETLDSRMRRKPLTLRESLSIGSQVADALAEAHAHGVIHRDIKPQNIIVTPRGQIKVMDFGLAKVVGIVESEAKTQSLYTTPGSIVGTVPYMSPEQIKSEQVDARSDIFSLGVVLHEMITGHPLFARKTAAETIAAILHEDPPDIAKSGIDIPRDVERSIKHCLAKNPNERFQSARDLALSLRPIVGENNSSPVVQEARVQRLRPYLWVGLALLITLLGIGWWQPWRRAPAGQLQQRLISSFPGAHHEASFSPDAGFITFISDAGGVPQVWIKNLAQGDPVQITTGDIAASRPRWSPKNDQIVFSRGESIWSVPPLRGTPRKIIEHGYNPSWSWDGAALVYERDDEIWTARADGNDQRKVEGVPTPDILLADRTPVFSPDGSLIAFFQCSKGPIGDIWIIPSAGGQARQLTFDDHFGGTPAFTPDGRYIVFSSLRAGSRTLWKIPVSGGTPEPVLVSAGEDTEPEFSRDGTKLIYTNTRNSFILTLWNPATNQTRELMEARYDLTDPSFSPDGKTISFFLVENNGDNQLHTIDLTGGSSLQVTQGKGERNIHPRWSPDGSSLYFYQIRPTFSFRRISLTGGLSSEVAPGWTWGTQNFAQIDPQDKLIAYVKQEKNSPPVTMIREIDTGRETTFKPLFRDPQWSHDGKSILGTDLTLGSAPELRQVSICTVETGVCRPLTRGRIPRWSRDGTHVYFLRDSKSGADKDLWIISTVTLEEKLLGPLLMHPIGAFYDVSPDGTVVYVRYSPGKPELWLAEFPH